MYILTLFVIPHTLRHSPLIERLVHDKRKNNRLMEISNSTINKAIFACCCIMIWLNRFQSEILQKITILNQVKKVNCQSIRFQKYITFNLRWYSYPFHNGRERACILRLNRSKWYLLSFNIKMLTHTHGTHTTSAKLCILRSLTYLWTVL